METVYVVLKDQRIKPDNSSSLGGWKICFVRPSSVGETFVFMDSANSAHHRGKNGRSDALARQIDTRYLPCYLTEEDSGTTGSCSNAIPSAMKSDRFERTICDSLAAAGITVNGTNPWDIRVHDNRFYRRVLADAELGIGESYMDEWWDCDAIDELICRALSANLDEILRRTLSLPALARLLLARAVNLQSRQRAFIIGERHYDLGNDLFVRMLDRRMNYSCAYWKNAETLDQAQEHKLELICRKIMLQPGMRVLDIGCGWGAFGRYAAETYDTEVVGITVSREQVALGRELCNNLPVEFRLQDYREVNEKFDRIVSVGMIEHVGYKNYSAFFDIAARCLNDGGIFLLHTIGNRRSATSGDPWTNRYIFPNGMLPSVAQLGQATEDTFVMEDWHNFGTDYVKTLLAWFRNFDDEWTFLKDRYGKRFYRMWKYYLLSMAGAFKARRNQLWQIVLSRNGIPGGYVSVR